MNMDKRKFRPANRGLDKSMPDGSRGGTPADPKPNFRPVPLCGLEAVLACFERRPAALKHLLFTHQHFNPLERVRLWMQERGIPVSAASAEALDKAAGHGFHDGIVALTERPVPGTPLLSDYETWSREGEPLLFVENSQDPANLGAIARAAAATGIKHLFLAGDTTLNSYFRGRAWSAAAGALDMLTVHFAGNDLRHLLSDLRPWFCVVGFTRPGGRRVDELKPICAPGRPLAIIIGGESSGISPQIGGKCEHLLHIPGAGGSALYTAGDTAAYGLPWLLLRRENKRKIDNGFRAKKRASKGVA